MKRLFRNIMLALGSLMLTGLYSCSNFENTADINGSTKGGSSPDGNTAVVKISVKEMNSSRAAEPEITLADFTEFTLKGVEFEGSTKTENKQTFGTWKKTDEKSAYQVLKDAEIVVARGKWEFTLEARYNNGIWSDSVESWINIESENKLSFILKFSGMESSAGSSGSEGTGSGTESQNATGSAELTLIVPDEIDTVLAFLYPVKEDGTLESVATTQKKITDVTEGTVKFTAENLPEGIYKAYFMLSSSLPATELPSRSEVVPTILGSHITYLNIVSGLKTTGTEEITSLESFTIDYVLNNKIVKLRNKTAPGCYSHYEEKTFPNLASSNGDFTFDGWYTKEDLSGDAVTSTKGMNGNIKLYAKWKSIPLTIRTKNASTTITISNPWSTFYYTVGDDDTKLTLNPTGFVDNKATILFPDANTIIRLFAEGSENTAESATGLMNINFDKDCYVYGNVMSLVAEDYDNATAVENSAFKELFKGNEHLINDTDPYNSAYSKEILLPAETLSANCYKSMFEGCTKLTLAPVLPAETLASSCYEGMFNSCSALESTPELPAINLTVFCYANMFENCSALKSAPELPSDIIPNQAYNAMFRGCTSLEEAPELNAVHLGIDCYYRMFDSCTSLTKAPALPAGTKEGEELAKSCYEDMFYNCNSLVTAPELPATYLAKECYKGMFYGCSKLVNVPETLPATELAEACYECMFSSCSSLVTAPELPATYLAKGCYKQMFYGCSKLVNVPETLPATELAESCYEFMFAACTALTKAPLLPAENLAENCYLGMFTQCSNLSTLVCFAKNFNLLYMAGWLDPNCIGTLSVKYYDNWKDIEKSNATVPSSWTIEAYTEE